jgi:hypothetical protein
VRQVVGDYVFVARCGDCDGREQESSRQGRHAS